MCLRIAEIQYIQNLLYARYKIMSKTDKNEIYILVREPDTGIHKQTNKFNNCKL